MVCLHIPFNPLTMHCDDITSFLDVIFTFSPHSIDASFLLLLVATRFQNNGHVSMRAVQFIQIASFFVAEDSQDTISPSHNEHDFEMCKLVRLNGYSPIAVAACFWTFAWLCIYWFLWSLFTLFDLVLLLYMETYDYNLHHSCR